MLSWNTKLCVIVLAMGVPLQLYVWWGTNTLLESETSRLQKLPDMDKFTTWKKERFVPVPETGEAVTHSEGTVNISITLDTVPITQVLIYSTLELDCA